MIASEQEPKKAKPLSARIDDAYRENPVRGLWFTLVFMLLGLFFAGLGRYGFMDIAEAQNVYNSLFTETDRLTPVVSWLQNLSSQHLPELAWAPRIPSAIAAVLTLCAFFYILLGLTQQPTYALLATGILAFNIPLMLMGHLAVADMVAFGLWLVPTLLLISNIYTHVPSMTRLTVAGILLACCLLVRGPSPLLWSGALVLLACVLRGGLSYNLKCLNPIPFVIGGLLVLIPWWRATHAGLDLTGLTQLFDLDRLWFSDFVAPLGQPWWTHLGMLLVGFFPWVVFLPLAFYHRVSLIGKSLNSGDTRAALPLLGAFWGLGGLVVLMAQPQPISPLAISYLLPGLALLVADRLDSTRQHPLGWPYALVAMLAIIMGAGLLALLGTTPAQLADYPWLGQAQQAFQAWLAQFITSPYHMYTTLAKSSLGLGSTFWVMGAVFAASGVFGVLWLKQADRQGAALMVGGTWVVMMLVSYALVPRLYEANYGALRGFLLQAQQEVKPGQSFITVGLKKLSVAAELGFQPVNITNLNLLKPLRDRGQGLYIVTTTSQVELVKKVLQPDVTAVCEQGYCLVKSKPVVIKNLKR